MKIVVYDTVGAWYESPFVYETLEDAASFFYDVHPGFLYTYRIAEIEYDAIVEEYTYDEYSKMMQQGF